MHNDRNGPPQSDDQQGGDRMTDQSRLEPSRRRFLTWSGYAAGSFLATRMVGSTEAFARGLTRLAIQRDGALNSVAKVGEQFFAVGANAAGGIVYSSAGGSAWTRLQTSGLDGAVLRGVSPGGPGVITVGADAAERPAIWQSTDGTAWVQIDLGDIGRGVFLDVVQLGPRVLALGALLDQETGEPVAGAIWVSANGERWQRLGDGGAFAGRSEINLTGVTRGGRRLVAVGFSIDMGLVWTSASGVTWTQAAVAPEIFRAAALNGVTDLGQQFVIVGTSIPDVRPLIWTSPDAQSWSPRRELPSSAFAQATPRDITAGGPGAIIVGGTVAGEPAVWTSPDTNGWTRVV